MGSVLEKAQRYLIAGLVFFVVLAILPFTPAPATDLKVLGYEVCAFIALALWLFTPGRLQTIASRSSPVFPLILAFLGINMAATFVSPNIGHSLSDEFIKWAALCILFVVAADAFYTPKQVWVLVRVICIAVSIASLYGLVQFRGMDPFPWEDTTGMLRTAPATFGNPNFASHTLTLAIILTCGLSTQRKGRWALLCIPLLLCHFALTRTRGSLLALAGALLLVFVALGVWRKVKKPSRAIALTLSIVLLVGMIGVAAVMKTADITTGQPYPDGSSERLRYHSFYGACRMILDRPWLGHGPGMYQVVSPQYWTSFEKERYSSLHKMNLHVHNEPLEVAVEAGFLAGIVYVAILALGLYYGLFLWFASDNSGRRPLGLTLAAFFFAFFLDGLFGFNVHVPVSAVLLFLVAGATAGVSSMHQPPSQGYKLHHGWSSLLWRFVVLGWAAIIPILGIRSFSAQFYHQRGQGALHYKAYTAAAECFQKAASLAPYNWLHPYYQGVTAMRMDNPQRGAGHFARTLELNPNYVDAQFKIAQALFNIATSSPKEDAEVPLREAVTYAERAAQLNPLLPEVHDLLGRASFFRAKRLTDSSHGENTKTVEKAWQDTEHHLLRAIEYGSEHKDVLYRLIAVTRLSRGDTLGAQKALTRSLENKPDEMETWQLFLQSSQNTGQYDVVRTSLNWCIENLNKSENTSDELATLYLLLAEVLYFGYGDESGAEDILLYVVQKYPTNVDTWSAFHAFAKSSGSQDVFDASLLQAIASPEVAEQSLPPLLHAVALGLGQNEADIRAGVLNLLDALQQHQATTTNAAETAVMFSWAADVLTAQAQQVSLSPRTAGEVFLQLGFVYEACQDFDAATQLYDRALPHLTDAQLLLCLLQKGTALINMGKTKMALAVFEQATANAPASFEARYALAQTLARDGQWARARQEYQTILSNFEIDEEGRRIIQKALEALPK